MISDTLATVADGARPGGRHAATESIDCAHAERCGGCSLIDLPYSEQLVVKRRRVESAVSRYGALQGVAVAEVLPADQRSDYRVRAKLMVDVGQAADAASDAGVRPVIGLYARAELGQEPASAHAVVDIPRCRVLHPALRQTAARLRALLEHLPPAAAPALTPVGAGGRLAAFDLRYVENRGESGVMVTLVLTGDASLDAPCASSVVEAVRDTGPVLGLAVNYRRHGATQVLGATTRCLWGTPLAPDRVGRAYHLATYGSFVQAHRGQSERVADLIAARLASTRPVAGSRVLDLYGGSGALSLPLASLGAEVTLVEAFGPATDCAARAAREQGFAGFAVHTGDAATIARRLASAGARFDAVIANPPRRGIEPGARLAMAELAPALIAYLSCDADTLARDLAELAWLGYRSPRLCPVDMIPLTDHVETLAVLERHPPPSPRGLYEDDHIRAFTKRAHQSTEDVAEAGGFVLFSPGGDESGPVLVAKTGAPSRDRPGRAVVTYVALVRGIARKKGSLGAARYERVAIAHGHSIVRWTSAQSSRYVRQALARVGHPIVGDRRFGDAATNRYFEEKHTIDRVFLHCVKVEWSRTPGTSHAPMAAGPTNPVIVIAPLADELTAALDKFGIDASEQLVIR